MWRAFLFFSVVMAGIFLSVNVTLAANQFDLIVNEIAWMGSASSTSNEWIELKNNTDQEISLENWTLSAKDGNPHITLTGTSTPHGYFLLERMDDESVVGIPADLIYSGALNNDGEVLELRDSEGNVIDTVSYPDQWPAGDNDTKQTMERTSQTTWQTSIDIGGTPKAENNIDNNEEVETPIATTTEDIITVSTSEFIITPGDIIINEFFPDTASGENEWIELYNNTTSTIDLSNFTIEDGLSVIAILSKQITPGGFFVYELTSNKLNNSGDIIILKYNTTTIDSVAYGDWDDGNVSDNAPTTNSPNSIAKSNSIFFETITPTKGATNIIIIDTPAPTPSAPDLITPQPLINSGSATRRIISYNEFDVVINELVSDPADGEVEWIELYNNTNFNIDLKDWIIEEGAQKQTSLSGTIYSKQMLVVEKPKGNLNNSGDFVLLMDGHGNIIDHVSYGSWDDGNVFDNALKTTDPNSLARFVDGQSTGIDYNDFRITTTPTKGLPNIINGKEASDSEDMFVKESADTTNLEEQMIINYPSLLITEALPNPSGSDVEGEFIEIFNPNSEQVDLTNWQLDDMEGGSKPHIIKNISIEAHEYLSFYRKTTGIALNNSSDSIRLFNPNGILVDTTTYDTIKENISYSLFDDVWQKTTVITSGEENVASQQNINQPTSSQVTTAQVIARIKVTGTVSVEPGILGTQIFYISDENIQVYSYKKDFPVLSVGDIVEVVGELSESGGERRIKIKTKADIKVIGQQEVLFPEEIAIADIGEDLEGHFVQIAGEVIEVRGSYVFIDDGSDEARVYIKSSTGIDKSIFKEALQVEVVGIVSQTKSGYRILPRYDTDIAVVGSVKGEQEAVERQSDTRSIYKYIIAVLIFLGITMGWVVYKKYDKKKTIQ